MAARKSSARVSYDLSTVMARLVRAIHDLLRCEQKLVDGRAKPDHDANGKATSVQQLFFWGHV